ncbi:hypothetical protein Cni_G02306 [Canna indica]|uniref:Uncharacterized protein n=1 Tax=Canna indica TaxID=4628 RepID=A0AAQ3JPH8_9LILI|nr:hypothetical protein Cni_G02306 [Canna indica]
MGIPAENAALRLPQKGLISVSTQQRRNEHDLNHNESVITGAGFERQVMKWFAIISQSASDHSNAEFGIDRRGHCITITSSLTITHGKLVFGSLHGSTSSWLVVQTTCKEDGKGY